jgi:hypothetical protein
MAIPEVDLIGSQTLQTSLTGLFDCNHLVIGLLQYMVLARTILGIAPDHGLPILILSDSELRAEEHLVALARLLEPCSNKIFIVRI